MCEQEVIDKFNATAVGMGMRDRAWMDANPRYTAWEYAEGGIGRGWRGLVLKLVEDLLELGWNGYVFQCKEKFGGLRFYIGEGSDAMLDRISRAEKDSFSVCELCGEPGELRGVSWSFTRCLECWKKMNRQEEA